MVKENLLSNLQVWGKEGLSQNRRTAGILIASNCIPLVGVLFFGWRVADIVFLYWMENVIIGGFNVLKILTCVPGNSKVPAGPPSEVAERLRSTFARNNSAENDDSQNELPFHAIKLFLAPFFTFHYGLFCTVHGIFLSVMMGDSGMLVSSASNPLSVVAQLLTQPWFAVAAIGLVASHGISYSMNFIGKGEYKKIHPIVLLFLPYPRIIVLHIAILFSAFLSLAFGSPIWLLILLIAGKIVIDCSLHLVEHGGVSQLPTKTASAK